MDRWIESGCGRVRRGGSRFVALLGASAALGVAMCACATASGAGSIGRTSAGGHYRLVQYPGAGFGGFYTQIAQARRTIDMEMYELEDATAERDLAAAVARGVRVRVLLDRDFSGARANRAAAAYLAAHGVKVRWAPARYIYHIKTTTFDGRTSDISSANLVSKYYATARDAEIIDSDPSQVRAIERTFSNDWTAGGTGSPKSRTVQASGLVWSPNTGSGTAEAALVNEIRSARNSVDFESEELSDPRIYQALAADARKGARCRVVMTRSPEWDSAFSSITKAGCLVRVYPDSKTGLYIHEKVILDDQATARESMLIGSQNASVTSLTRNRELGILLTRKAGGAGAIAAAGAAFDSDFRHASPWSSPATKPKPKPKPKPTPSPVSTPTPTGCQPKTSSGNCYEPGEYCSAADHGMSGVAGNGDAIVCEDNNGWRWEPK
jgi:phosphatidylserine/phosphatidylglycerophosphate/cardiolipin synthase-like enzyme